MTSVTVIVPVFNQEEYVLRCVNSILNQTYQNYTLILIDDGSSDSSAAICDLCLSENSNVFVIHKLNGGLSSARNIGLELNAVCSLSDWVTFIDSDDWVNKRYFELMIDVAHKEKVKTVASNFERTDYNQELRDNNPEIEIYSPEEFICADRSLFSVSCCKLYDASCYESIRFPVGKYHEDEFTTYRILFNNDKIALIKFPLYNYFMNPESITQAKWSPKRLDVLEALNLQCSYFKSNGYMKAFHSSLHTYFWMLYYSSKEAKGEFPDLARKLKLRFIKEFNRHKEYFPIEEYGYFYAYVNPLRYRLYLYINKAKSLLRKQ